MKPHFIIRLRTPIDGEVPYWADVAQRRAAPRTQTFPELDQLIRQHNLEVQITREYTPATMSWSPQELQSGFNRIYRVILQESREIPSEMIAQIQLLPIVEHVRIGRIAQAPIPTPVMAMGFPGKLDQARKEIYLDETLQQTEGHPAIKIAVLDTGVYLKHSELKHCLLPGKDFVNIIDGTAEHLEDKLNSESTDVFGGDFKDEDNDPDDPIVGHGTHVAGIICAKGVRMPKGVVPKCKILPVRVLAALKQGSRYVGAGLVDNINTGIKWAVDQGAEVINMSLGIRHTEGGLPHEEVVNYAKKKGVTIVAAAGNDGQEELYYPGALPYVIAVGATDETNGIAPFSTFGKQVSFVAPGTNIYSTSVNNDYAFSTGTSHASPFVAGAVAMLKSYAREHGRKLSDSQVKYILKNTADKVDRNFKHRKAGFGKLNLIDALKLLQYKLNNINH
ncbi:MAG: S8 family peptidase [Bacteroidota bacterium]